MSAPGLLDGPAPRVRAIASSLPFLDVFVAALCEATEAKADPMALGDALILLPNRRAARGLIDAFAAHLGGAALLPTIRPLGDLEDDVDVWGPEPIAFDIPPPIPPAQRRMELAALTRARLKAEFDEDDPVRALALADDLAALLDSAASVDALDWSAIDALVEDAELAQHWRRSAQFLHIIASHWPERLAAENLIDPGARRSAILLALAQNWRRRPPERPVIVAGSTGSLAATRVLMQAVSRLPRGVIVLPGLDADLDDAAWARIDAHHPQSALAATLDALGLDRKNVPPLGAETRAGAQRRALIREALVPADATADWIERLDAAGGPAFAREALEGVTFIEAATEEEEASVIALVLREALEGPDGTCALVTPDAGLARRVEAKLARWGIAADASHGAPLSLFPPGRLILLLCELACARCDPVALAALLAQEHCTFGLTPDSFDAMRREIERKALRGPARLTRIEDLRSWAGESALVDALIATLSLLPCENTETDLARFAEAIAAAAEAATLRADGVHGSWAGPAGEACAQVLEELIAHGAALGAMRVKAAARLCAQMVQARETAPERGDARCAIWGPLEARLQRRDVLVLGGLSECVWPAPPREDGFLSRAMRAKLGLPSPEARIGLAAHDFAQLAAAPRVVLTRSERRGAGPAIASRWLWRLRALVGGAGLALPDQEEMRAWARRLHEAPPSSPPRAPRPRPPANARLSRISVTQVETLIRDPYAIYARRILGLEALKDFGAPADAAARGTAIHAALELLSDGGDAAQLLAALDRQLAAAGFSEERRGIEAVRLAQSVHAYLQWRAGRRPAATFVETSGALALKGGVTLSAKADRLEIDAQGRAAIIDFKSGAPPSDKQVESGLSAQLLLEAAMLARGAFKDAPAARAHELIYWRFGGRDPGAHVVSLSQSAEAAGEAALASLERLLARYADPDQPFLSKPRVQFARDFGDYDHLARRKEWADAEGEP